MLASMCLAALTQIAAPQTEPPQAGLTGVLSEEEWKALHELPPADAPAPRGSSIELPGGGKAYLSLPEGSKAPLPGVIVIHEWWGLNRHIKAWSDRLAADGYAALAVDLYGGAVAETREDALKAMQTVDAERARAIVVAAEKFLRTDPRVAAPATGSIGWCFGGKWSLETALACPELDACVLYYGTPVTDSAKLGAVKAKVLGVFGNQDRGIPPALVDEFEAGLAAAKVDHRILRYDAEHAFANPSGTRYDEAAARAAWEEVRSFLTANLKRPAR